MKLSDVLEHLSKEIHLQVLVAIDTGAKESHDISIVNGFCLQQLGDGYVEWLISLNLEVDAMYVGDAWHSCQGVFIIRCKPMRWNAIDPAAIQKEDAAVADAPTEAPGNGSGGNPDDAETDCRKEPESAAVGNKPELAAVAPDPEPAAADNPGEVEKYATRFEDYMEKWGGIALTGNEAKEVAFRMLDEGFTKTQAGLVVRRSGQTIANWIKKRNETK